jgi:hypothetical protein
MKRGYITRVGKLELRVLRDRNGRRSRSSDSPLTLPIFLNLAGTAPRIGTLSHLDVSGCREHGFQGRFSAVGVVFFRIERVLSLPVVGCRSSMRECDHGNWLPWIEANLKFNRVTAWEYMRCFHKRDELSNVSPTKH